MNLKLIIDGAAKFQPVTDNMSAIEIDLIECEENRNQITEFIPLEIIIKMYDREIIVETLKGMNFL